MNIAIIFAGGSGVRMGAGMPKQFLEINGKPIIIHTLDNFQNSPSIDKTVSYTHLTLPTIRLV